MVVCSQFVISMIISGIVLMPVLLCVECTNFYMYITRQESDVLGTQQNISLEPAPELAKNQFDNMGGIKDAPSDPAPGHVPIQ